MYFGILAVADAQGVTLQSVQGLHSP